MKLTLILALIGVIAAADGDDKPAGDADDKKAGPPSSDDVVNKFKGKIREM